MVLKLLLDWSEWGGLWHFSSERGENLLLESSESKESKNEELKLKFGMPQVEHVQETLELARASYSLGSIFKHLVWYQNPQLLTQKIAGWFFLHGRPHNPQGNLKTGPGLTSMSFPARRRRLDSRKACLDSDLKRACEVLWSFFCRRGEAVRAVFGLAREKFPKEGEILGPNTDAIHDD